MSKENKTYDLEERLIDFAVRIIRTAKRNRQKKKTS